ncbi:MAG: TetR/AcrR family transcriptional regulator [Pararhodobacter sp.]|nr:TetR/AcrR family transcriptional regulator [Pararhodobacter sp.]
MPARSHPQTLPDAAEGPVFADVLRAQAEGARKGVRTRAELCVALCQCLDDTPPTSLTISSLCQSAGVSHGTFYIYFPDRNALIGAVLLAFIDFLQTRMRRASRLAADDPVRAATATYVTLFEHNTGLMACLVNHLDGYPEARDAFQALNRNWLDAVVAAVARQWRQAGRAVDRAELLRRAYALGGMTDQYLTGLLLSKDPALQAISSDREAVIDTLTLLWHRGLDR